MQQAPTMNELSQDKINAEARWYPFVAVAGVFGAALAVVKFLF
jgi:hypothetical protein